MKNEVTDLKRTLDVTYEQALEMLPGALQAEGFGILTEIDVAQTLKKKIDIDFRKYKILGACNPPLAHQAISAQIDIGLLLPCNVIVYENDQGKAVVAAVDPLRTIASVGADGVEDIAKDVRARLERVIEQL